MKRTLALLILAVWSTTSAADCNPGGHGKLAIIIDDIGYNFERGLALARLPAPVTLAIIPATPHAKQLASAAQQHGKEIMIHMPMASAQLEVRDPLTLTANLTDEGFATLLEDAIAGVPGATGLNNHMGSGLTQDQAAMTRLMALLQANNLFFIDSRTTAATVAAHSAAAAGIPYASRSVFLDNERDPLLIAKHLLRAVDMAESSGSAIAIGHPYPETLAVLRDYLPRLPDSVTLAPASSIAHCESAQRLTSIP